MLDTSQDTALNVLGGFVLALGPTAVPVAWGGQRLLAYLALQGRPVSRSAVAAALWPDTTAARSHANLRSSLFRVQRTSGSVIDAAGQQLAVAAHVRVDLAAAKAAAARLLDDVDPCDGVLTSAVSSRLALDLLPDWYDDEWLVTEREQYRQVRLYALEAMCRRLTAAGRFGEAVDVGLLAVRAEPLRESAHVALVRAYLAAGNRSDALSQYERCRRLLRDELGLVPSATLVGLLPRGAAR
jgi:DNA-binding SARP family transcriptional activator